MLIIIISSSIIIIIIIITIIIIIGIIIIIIIIILSSFCFSCDEPISLEHISFSCSDLIDREKYFNVNSFDVAFLIWCGANDNLLF